MCNSVRDHRAAVIVRGRRQPSAASAMALLQFLQFLQATARSRLAAFANVASTHDLPEAEGEPAWTSLQGSVQSTPVHLRHLLLTLPAAWWGCMRVALLVRPWLGRCSDFDFHFAMLEISP